VDNLLSRVLFPNLEFLRVDGFARAGAKTSSNYSVGSEPSRRPSSNLRRQVTDLVHFDPVVLKAMATSAQTISFNLSLSEEWISTVTRPVLYELTRLPASYVANATALLAVCQRIASSCDSALLFEAYSSKASCI